MIDAGIEKEWAWLCEWANDVINTIEPKSYQDPVRQRVFLVMAKIESEYLNTPETLDTPEESS